MNQPKIDTDGETWQYVWPDTGMAIGFEALRERSDGLHGELWVAGDPHVNGNGPHIVWTTFNLSSATARSRMATQIASRPGGRALKGGDWLDMLEYACTMTAQDFRKGDQAIDLSEGQPILDLPYLVYPLLPERQPTILFADGESCKGWLALGMCISLRLGGEVVPGLKPTRQCNSLYLDWETDKDQNVRRQEYIYRGLDLHTRAPGVYYRRMLRPLADDLSKVRDLIERTHAELLVVDSIGLAAGSDIKESDPAMRFMAGIRALGITSLLLGHVSKAVAAQKGNDPGRVIGSTFYQLLARSAWELRADAETQPVIVGFYHRKANLGPRQKSFALKIAFEDQPDYRVRFQRCDLEESGIVAEKAPLPQRMAAALKRGSKPTSELAEQLGVSEATMRTTLNRASSKGVVVQLASQPGKGGKGRESLWGLTAFSEGGTTA